VFNNIPENLRVHVFLLQRSFVVPEKRYILIRQRRSEPV